jgi:two-component system cell cycle sensor histidine kinase/response regulator CckA
MDFFHWLFGAGDFMSHGHCYLWIPSLVRLHAVSDLAIAIAYIAISCTLVLFVRRTPGPIPFHWMFLAFGLFIVACAFTHLLEVWTIWVPVYWLSGGVKLIAALASVATAVALPPLIPKARDLLRVAELSGQHRAELEASNAALQREIAERTRAEEEIRRLNAGLETRVKERTRALARANEALMQTSAIVQYSQDAIYRTASDTTIISWNPAAERLFGYPAGEILGQSSFILVPPDRVEESRTILECLRNGEIVEHLETARQRRDGVVFEASLTVSPILNSSAGYVGASVIARDITESKRAERHLRETQKLESLGLIAGGVAHDFNNLLVGILGNASMALESLAPSNPDRILIEHVVSASEKAAALTRQLLAYAGKGRFVTQKVDFSSLVREISSLIQASIPRTVRIRLELSDELPVVDADPGQLQQLIMNLVINGAEAVPEGEQGTVLVTTAAQEVDETYLRNNWSDENVAPGTYVMLEVNDTGSGMSPETQARIFDPFFTTKFTGRGLGLAAVIGIVRGHKGLIRVYSIPGKGSTFKILLPAGTGTAEVPHAGQASDKLRGSGTILIVDDEPTVLAMAKRALERFGYKVLTAVNGADGVTVFQEHPNEISAVLLDMTMPVMSGDETFRRLRAIHPEVRVILSSGYNEVEAVRRFTTKGLAGFIQKPYTAAQLAEAVKSGIGKTGQRD